MIKETIYCDLCTEKIVASTWEFQARPITVITETACTNPMAAFSAGHQSNKLKYEHLCYECQRFMAQGIADLIKERKEMSS